MMPPMYVINLFSKYFYHVTKLWFVLSFSAPIIVFKILFCTIYETIYIIAIHYKIMVFVVKYLTLIKTI